MGFYGDDGTLTVDRRTYKIYDPAGKLVEEQKFASADGPHVENFLECVKTGARPNADIEEGHKSTLLCHLGNIAYRRGETLHIDPATHKPTDSEAAKLWGREYRKGWEPVV